MKRIFIAHLLSFLIFSSTGCGYTTGSLLPAHIKNIYIDNFANKIPITDEISDKNRYKTYYPLLEVDITRAVIDKFIYDGHLKVTKREDADIILEGSLVDFRREPTKYGDYDTIDQYRIAIMVNMNMIDAKKKVSMWTEDNFSGSDYYFTTGPQAQSESSAIADALSDLARRVVERTIEVW